MKGYLSTPRPVSGLDNAINENKYLEFYADIVNNRNLDAKEFFNYIKKYGNNYKISLKIEYISYNISSIKANEIKLIIDYKKAELNNDKEKIEKLKESFKKISDIRISNEKHRVKGTNVFYDLPSKKFNKEEVNKLINEYLNGKDLKENQIRCLYERIKKHLKDLDYKTVNDFNMKVLGIDVVSTEEINQIIKVLNYFIINLQNNIVILDDLYSNYMLLLSDIKELQKEQKKLNKKKLQLELKKEKDNQTKDMINEIEKVINKISKKITKEELEMTKNGELIEKFMSEINDKLCDEYKNNVSRLYISKSAKLKKYLKNYRVALEYLLSFKDKIENNEEFEDFSSKLKYIDLEEDYIKDIIDKTRTIIKHYKNMNKYNLCDDKLDDMKLDYISKVYEPNN